MHEVISEEKMELLQEFHAPSTPPVKSYSKQNILTLRVEIGKLSIASNALKSQVKQTDIEIGTLRRELFEAEMQHTEITVCSPSGSSKKSRLSEKMAQRIIDILLKEGMIGQEDLIL